MNWDRVQIRPREWELQLQFLEELRNSGALFLVTTHYPEVKQYADRTEGIQNARMTFNRETLKPEYQLVIGEAGEAALLYCRKNGNDRSI